MASKKSSKNLYTWAGVPVEEIPEKLADTFPLEAFKPLEGSSTGLSDIDTGHMIERLTAVFGVKGLGWNLKYDPSDLVVYGDPAPTHSFNQLLAWLRNAVFEYYLYEDDGATPVRTVEIQTSGWSVNNQPYAEEGARTNATGAAIKWLLFQNALYKGMLDTEIKEKKPARQGGGQRQRPAKPKEQPKAKPPKDSAKEKSALERAYGYKIPDDLPYAGESLQVLLDADAAGVAILGYLAGRGENPTTGKAFEPQNPEENSLMKAAEYILDNVVNKSE